jgi:histidine triad (HIT) family protein
MTDTEIPTDSASCVFCAIAKGELTPEVLAYRDHHTAVFPSLHQRLRNQGHMLVVPAVHVAQIYDVEGVLAGALMSTVARVARAVKHAFAADGVSVRQSNEPHGGQDVFHVHFHVIPRFAADDFDIGDDRFPFGAVEIAIHERVKQAAAVREELGRRPC